MDYKKDHSDDCRVVVGKQAVDPLELLCFHVTEEIPISPPSDDTPNSEVAELMSLYERPTPDGGGHTPFGPSDL